ncbi:DUF4388 domain-containing protein [Persicimonas caeni]|nr:DUF4388 domain-containing protein [Persicimonas caeni]
MHRILIVDEDEHLLWALEKNLFPERDDLLVITAPSGEEGMEILKGGNVDLLVSDIKMPGKVDGFQLILRAKEIAPDARVVIMTSFGSGRVESFADRMGITHYIEKPFNISELRDMALDLLDEKEGFQGMLSDLELTDIIQMLCLAKRTTLLHLKHKEHRGKIVFDRGDLVHAEFDGEDGPEAVYRMLALRQGDIFMESDVDYDEPTIHVGWQDLLLEAVKRADEMRLAEASSADEEESSENDGTPFSSFRPSESAEIDLKKVSEDEDEESAEVDPDSTGDDNTDRLTGDSFFTEEELEEIGMASSEALESADVFEADSQLEEPEADEPISEPEPLGLDESSISEALEESSVSEVEEQSEPQLVAVSESEVSESEVSESEVSESEVSESEVSGDESLGFDEASVAADGGQSLGDEASGPEVLEDVASNLASPVQTPKTSLIAALEDFVDECAKLRVTGLTGPGEDAEASFVETSQAGKHDPHAVSEKLLSTVSCAQRIASALDRGAHAEEMQLTLADAYVVVRRIAGTEQYHFAVVGRDASLGVVLVLMRQFSERLGEALQSRDA